MPTPFYLPASTGTAAAVSPNISALWNTNPSLVRLYMPRTKTNTAMEDDSAATYSESSATAGNMVHRQYISDPLPFAQTISGTFRLIVRAAETDAAADATLQVHIRVLSNDGTTSRGNLYAGQSAALNSTIGALGQEMATTPTTRVFNNIALNSISAQANDRICVEIGHRYANTSATTYGASLTFGDASAVADHAFNATSTAQLVPYIEFSQDLFRVTTSRSTTWNVAATVAAARSTTYSVLASVSSAKASTWNVLAAVSKTANVSWDVNSSSTAVIASRSTSWDVAGRVATTRAASWDVIGRATATRDLTWDTRLRVQRFREISWDVTAILSTVGTTRDVSWGLGILPPPPFVPPAFTMATALSDPAGPRYSPNYIVVVRNQALQRVGAISVRELSFTVRHNDVGDGTSKCPRPTPTPRPSSSPTPAYSSITRTSLGLSSADLSRPSHAGSPQTGTRSRRPARMT